MHPALANVPALESASCTLHRPGGAGPGLHHDSGVRVKGSPGRSHTARHSLGDTFRALVTLRAPSNTVRASGNTLSEPSVSDTELLVRLSEPPGTLSELPVTLSELPVTLSELPVTLSELPVTLSIRLLHPQHLDGIWSGLMPYRLPFDNLSEYQEPRL